MISYSADLAWPLVSIIVPCYNHGAYLPKALASIWQQQYPAVEVIVVNDGSTDKTSEIVQAYPTIKYIYQKNQGLSAARNKGIAHSTGQYLVFLDADDWLLPDALQINLRYLRQNPALAFVSGRHEKVFIATGLIEEGSEEVTANHYERMLVKNYIGMHGAVMYQRWIFDTFLFDTTLKACEDYDLYFRIIRVHPVAHHAQRVAAYRMHGTNMSGNIHLMLSSVLTVLKRQHSYLRNTAEEQAYARGLAFWQDYYGAQLYQKLKRATTAPTLAELVTLATLTPKLAQRYFLPPRIAMLKNLLKKHAPGAILKQLHQAGLYPSYQPALGDVDLGDLGRLTPFSTEFGYDRGGPIDRYYIEGFLAREAASIGGRVLEIGDNDYTLRYGGDKLTQSDILHIDASNPHATLIGDLSDAPHVPDNAFDCIVLTQTLHLIYDFKAALRTCHRILRPGGVLLLTAPGLTPIDKGEWKETWYWSFTDKALRRLLAETFPKGEVEIGSYGNVHAATAYLYGMGLPEISPEKLDYYDPQFQVINTVKAVKRLPHA